jgi:2-oxoglutarate dehydrogenase E1 component
LVENEYIPEGFVLQRQVQKVIDDRLKMQTGEMPLELGCCRNFSLCIFAR